MRKETLVKDICTCEKRPVKETNWLSDVFRVNESCLIYDDFSYMNHVFYIIESCLLYKSFMFVIPHVTHMNEACYVQGWVISHIWMSHVTHMKEPCHTYGWAMSHIQTSHDAHMNEQYHTFELMYTFKDKDKMASQGGRENKSMNKYQMTQLIDK